ncbi:hypothetical protein Q31b_24800 [Novipirellula aureliae]|uniref:Uncharacterized protein n=1 Tax=Novipirellula aureliae TaxID=2527966 RepID=A0A5C6E3N6_9BACT|nr:hypothetical protein Q31b_24800 [Novipirellula aureliae]
MRLVTRLASCHGMLAGNRLFTLQETGGQALFQADDQLAVFHLGR